MDTVADGGGRPTRNLILVRAGDASLHGSWAGVPEARNWRLHISYFGKRGAPVPLDGQMTWSYDPVGSKWPGVAAALASGQFDLDDFDYIAIPDDDVIATPEDWNRAFEIARARDLAACQLSLRHESFFGWRETLHRPGFLLRYVPVVELMVPIIRMDVFRRMIPYLALNGNLWAMDHIVGQLAAGEKAIAVLDDVQVLHTRAFWTSAMYDAVKQSGQTPYEEEDAFLKEHGIRRLPRTSYGGVLKSGRRVRSVWWSNAFIVWAYLRKKYRAHKGLLQLATVQDGVIALLPWIRKRATTG